MFPSHHRPSRPIRYEQAQRPFEVCYILFNHVHSPRFSSFGARESASPSIKLISKTGDFKVGIEFDQSSSKNLTYHSTARVLSRHFALIVGINEYNPPPISLRPLRGAVADAQAFKQWLEWRGVPAENIVLLTNESATCAAIIAALTQLKTDNRIRRGDPIFIFFAGHGAEVKAPDGWECGRADRMIQVIVPHDCDAIKSGKPVGPIADRVLGALIGNISEKKGNNIVGRAATFRG